MKGFPFPSSDSCLCSDSSSSLGLCWGMTQTPGLFIFHIVCTLIGALHPRDFLRKHQFGLLTILLQTRFPPPSFSLFVKDKIHFFSWTWIHCLRFLKSLLWDTEILSLRQRGKGRVAHVGNCDSCRNWNDEADATITKAQRWSNIHWWKGKNWAVQPRQASACRSFERWVRLRTGELSTCLLRPFHAEPRARPEAACSGFKPDQQKFY